MANDSETFNLIQDDVKDILTGFGPTDFNDIWDRIGENELNRYDRTFYAFVAGGLSACKMVIDRENSIILELQREVRLLRNQNYVLRNGD